MQTGACATNHAHHFGGMEWTSLFYSAKMYNIYMITHLVVQWVVAALLLPVGLTNGGSGCFIIKVRKVPLIYRITLNKYIYYDLEMMKKSALNKQIFLICVCLV